MNPLDVTTLPVLPLLMLAVTTVFLATLSWLLYLACTDLYAQWTTCRHGPENTDYIDIPDDWGLDAGVWCVCRRCGDRTVITRARMRELDLE